MVSITITIVSAILGYLGYKISERLCGDKRMNAFFTVTISVVVLMAIAGIVGGKLPVVGVEKERIELISLRDDSDLSGRFFLGSGFINSTEYYFYYSQANNGGYIPGKIPVDNVTIFEDQTENAYIIVLKPKFINPVSYWIALIPNETMYEVHVPPGTILRQFSIQ